MNNFIKAVDRLIHLHMCEQEGVASDFPFALIEAVQNVCDEREKLDVPQQVPDCFHELEYVTTTGFSGLRCKKCYKKL
jgi:hypothetical protein